MIDKYDIILFDFDDTVWSRKYKDDLEELECSVYNINFINKFLCKKSMIISGNSFETIKYKLDYGKVSLKNSLWADSNSSLYKKDKCIYTVEENIINESAIKLHNYLVDNYCISSILVYSRDNIVNLKIRPLVSEDFRNYLENEINRFIIPELGIKDCIAKKTGKTTIDIFSKVNSKTIVFDKLNLHNYNTLYIGDEIFGGNDSEIAHRCTNYINVKNVFDTRNILNSWRLE